MNNNHIYELLLLNCKFSRGKFNFYIKFLSVFVFSVKCYIKDKLRSYTTITHTHTQLYDSFKIRNVLETKEC